MRPAAAARRLDARVVQACVIALVSIDLKDAVEAVEDMLGMFATASWRVVVDHDWWISAAVAAIVAQDSPQIAGLGSAPARIEHGCPGLVHEQAADCFITTLMQFQRRLRTEVVQLIGRLTRPSERIPLLDRDGISRVVWTWLPRDFQRDAALYALYDT